mmetsp:Transcript_20461/g.49688  ORF Transcript_20461/g.49688 Transcript_20461/m.49688 type:complete len:235 (-) Transcript_20461:190-894(-)
MLDEHSDDNVQGERHANVGQQERIQGLDPGPHHGVRLEEHHGDCDDEGGHRGHVQHKTEGIKLVSLSREQELLHHQLHALCDLSAKLHDEAQPDKMQLPVDAQGASHDNPHANQALGPAEVLQASCDGEHVHEHQIPFLHHLKERNRAVQHRLVGENQGGSKEKAHWEESLYNSLQIHVHARCRARDRREQARADQEQQRGKDGNTDHMQEYQHDGKREPILMEQVLVESNQPC